MAADLLNAGWYAAEGDYKTAALSVGAIFGGSAAVLAVKYGGTATKVVTKMASKGFTKSASHVKKYFGLTDEVLSSADDVAKQADEVVEGAAKGGVQYSDDLVKAAQQLYPNKAGKIELHHITPKYLGGAVDGPLVPLDAAYHQVITNEFRLLWPYGKGVPSASELQSIMEQVYAKYPLPPGY